MSTTSKTKQKDGQQRQSRLVFVISGLVLLALVLSYFFIPAFHDFIDEAVNILTSDDQERIKKWVSEFGIWGPVLIVVAMIAQMFLIIIPSVVLMIVSTLAYGPWWGSLISYTAVIVASSIAYYIGLHASNVFLDKLIGKSAEDKVNHYIQKYGSWAIVLFRVSPFLSNDAVSFVAGIGEMRYFKFIAATTAGILPLIAMIAYLGKDTERLETGMWWISGITFVAFLVYFFINRRKKKQRTA